VSIVGELHKRGVLGINRRNSEYTLRWNDRRLYKTVDDKLETKRLCEKAGIPTPRLLAVARHHFELRTLRREMLGLETFALKPASGAMGNGIVVVIGRDDDRFLRPAGRFLRADGLEHHASSILSGLYSLGGRPDAAMVEERLIVHPEMARIVTDGVPDVRVVVYRGVPVMAMTRLPTHRSGGRANLHQGAVGAGIDLVTGRIIAAMSDNRMLRRHPDTGEHLIGQEIPEFEVVMHIALAATDQTGLGYVGADVVVDAERGPMILELNARPGLAVQLASRAGLRPRLQAVDREIRPDVPLADRLEMGRRIAVEATRAAEAMWVRR
jgi:alpha-L-glutamate ligase-like protein